MRILFVCNANIVRSFMAERVLKSWLQRCGNREVAVSSAGLLDMHGAPADPTARKILRDNGIDDEGHQSRIVTEDLVEAADLIVTMEQEQVRRIGEQYPSAGGKIRLLKSYLPGQNQGGAVEDVKDPYRRSIFDYRVCFAEISLAMEELRKCI